jgi:VPDSG-CTERM motif
MIDSPITLCSNNPMKTKTPTLNASPRFSLTRCASRSLMAPFVAAVIAWCPLQTRADTIALSFTPSGQTTITGAGTDTLGWAFSLSAPVTVTQLGVWDQGGDGLTREHQVTIWDSTGTLILAQTTVPSGMGATLDSGFRYVSIGSVVLAAGNYTIGALFIGTPTSTSNEDVAINAVGIGTNSPVTYQGSRGEPGDAYPATDNYISQSNSYFGPNFQFTTSTSVPDAGTTGSLFGLSLMGLAFLRRKLC